MDIINNKEDKTAFEAAKREILLYDEFSFTPGSVCSGTINIPGFTMRSNRQGICHGWVSEFIRINRHSFNDHTVIYVSTSLRYFRPNTPYAYIRNIDKSIKITEEIQRRFFSDLLSSKIFESITKESLIFNSNSKREDFIFIKVTKDNIGMLGPFLVLTRHPYEQDIASLENRVDYYRNPFGLFSSWYYLCYKDTMKFDEIIPLMSSSSILNNKVFTMGTPHTHSSIDGVIRDIHRPSRETSFGFSKANFDFLNKKEVFEFLKSDVEKKEEILGYFDNEFLYMGLNGRDTTNRKIDESSNSPEYDSNVPLGDWKELKNTIRNFNKNAYGV